MKKFKNKSLIIGLASVLGVASLAATSCSTTSQKANTNPTKVDRPAPFQAVSHHTVQFVKPTDTPYDNLRYQGRTTLDVKDGYPFGILAAPTPVYEGYVFDHWVFATGTQAGTTIEKSTPITEDCDIVPVMTEVAEEINIVSDDEDPHVLYDGFKQSKKYSVTKGSTVLPATAVVWSLTTLDGEQSWDVGITEDQVEASCTVYTKTSPYMVEIKEYYLKAVVTTSSGTETKLFKLTIYPPYCYDGTEEIGGVPYDYGKCYWVFDNTYYSEKWIAIPSESVCPSTFNPATPFTCISHPTTSVGEVSTVARNDDLSKWIHIFPGCEINSVGDNFMRESNFNGELHGGVNAITKEPKVLASIGDNFLQDCALFNKDISDVFTLGVDYSISIGDCFMDGCVAFANGGEDFVLPTAAIYGDYFMNGCTALTGEITLGSQVIQIGDYFMNETGISAVTIPATFGGTEAESDVIGACFLTDCENLDHVTILTDDVSYFKELNMPAQDRASFVRFSEYDDETGITLLCPKASEQFLEGFTELDGTDGYYRFFTLDTNTYIRSWDYAGPGGTVIHFENPYNPMEATTFADNDAATTAYSNAIADNPDILLADLLTQAGNMHNEATIDNWIITLKNLDTTDPKNPKMTYRVQINQNRSMAGLIDMTQICDLTFTNIPFRIDSHGTYGPSIVSPYIFDPSVMSEIEEWSTVLTRLQNDTTWSIKGSASLIYEPLQASLEAYAINKVWTNLNINSYNASGSDFLTIDNPIIQHPYGAYGCTGLDSNYLSLCTIGE